MSLRAQVHERTSKYEDMLTVCIQRRSFRCGEKKKQSVGFLGKLGSYIYFLKGVMGCRLQQSSAVLAVAQAVKGDVGGAFACDTDASLDPTSSRPSFRPTTGYAIEERRIMLCC